MVFSGVLTSKPLEYWQQCYGLPQEWVQESDNPGYADITPFLDELLPIKKYRKVMKPAWGLASVEGAAC